MRTLEEVLDEVFVVDERVSRVEIYRRAVAQELPAAEMTALDSLPEGEYARDEVNEALQQIRSQTPDFEAEGVPPHDLDDDDLLRELESLHRTRHETFLHASTQALQRHSERTTELELEYLRRYPERQVDEERLRSGARRRD